VNEDPVVDIKRASKGFRLPSGDHLALLQNVSLTIRAGESMAVRGRSGSGKSTLLRALGLFIPFDSGYHSMFGLDVRTASDRTCSTLRARSIGFVFQDFRLMPNLTAIQNVEYGCLLAGMGRRAGANAARNAMARVGLSDRLQSKPSQLSGGERQRVAIARALVKQPSLVLADEPTGSLDPANAEIIVALLLDAVRDSGAALVLVTHDEGVSSRCQREVELRNGEIDNSQSSVEAAAPDGE
jgi:predicted ABC-type transport system involved in lysophospholipase L1 biosynthesis ATPase subunit